MLINRRDLDFQLFEMLNVESLCKRARYAEHDRETLVGVIDAAYHLAAEHFAPYAAGCDAHEPELRDGRVNCLPQTGTALQAIAATGFFGAPFDMSIGGLQLPWVVCQACNGVFAAANVGFYGYAMLTQGAANLLLAHGSEEQIKRYAVPMVQGRFFGTMCLSEPQAGSSLADVRTRAVRQSDGRYLLTGNKMWISGGEHELAENIIHLVLARTPEATPGAKGISLFIVPRYRVSAQCERGELNDVRLVGLNHKMGFRGTVNTVLAFGERGECVGDLVGTQQCGLAYMFHMMNESRIGVGLCSTALGYAGYVHALEYARHRPQGRPLATKDPTQPPVPIVQHGDVRRMLLAQKAYVEGALSLVLYCAYLVDEQRTTDSPAAREELRLLLELLTPVAKSWPSEYCLEANKLAIQVLGGYGYSRDYPVERLYRDNRLNHIHEGTYGIQGLDVLGRKVQMRDGASLRLLLARIGDTIVSTTTDARLADYAAQLADAIMALRRTTDILVECAAHRDVSLALANATVYLEALGHIVIAWRWLEQARIALQCQAKASQSDRAFYEGKLAACRYFYRYELPKVGMQLKLLEQLDDTTLRVREESL